MEKPPKYLRSANKLGDGYIEGVLFDVSKPVNHLETARKLSRIHVTPEDVQELLKDPRYKPYIEKILKEKVEKGKEGFTMFDFLKAERRRIFDIFGLKELGIHSFRQIAKHSNNHELIEKIHGKVLKHFSYLAKDRATVEQRVMGFSDDANGLVSYVARRHYPEMEEGEEQNNDVETTEKMAELLLMALDERRDEGQRYEAKLKLAAEDEFVLKKKAAKENRGALGQFHRLLSEYFLSYPGKFGKVDSRYMVVTLNSEDNSCVGEPEIVDQKPKLLEPNQRVVYMGMRQFETGTGLDRRMIHLLIKSRKKAPMSYVLKRWRKDEVDHERSLFDINGIMAVCKNDEERNLFIDQLEETLKGQGFEITIPRKRKDIGRSNKMEGVKFDIHIQNPRGKKMKNRNPFFDEKRMYEIQVYTNAEYANYKLQIPGAWKLYEQERFHDSVLPHLIFPEKYNPSVEHSSSAISAWGKALSEIEVGAEEEDIKIEPGARLSKLTKEFVFFLKNRGLILNILKELEAGKKSAPGSGAQE